MSNVVPEGWAIKTVGELSSVKRGASPRPIKDARWWGGNVGWVRISDVTSSNKYLKKTTQYLSAEGVSKSVKINKGEVVLSICATIGRPIIVSVDACIHDGFVWFDKLSQSIDREFWYYFLTNKEEYFSSQRQSGTQGNLNTAIVSDLNCLLPPLPEQKKIAAILTSVDEVIEKTQAQIDKLKDLKTAMMQELLTCGVGVDGKPHTEFKDSPVGRTPKGWEVVTLGCLVEPKGLQTGPFGSQLHSHEYVETGVPVVMPKDMKNNLISNDTIARIPQEKAKELIKHQVRCGDILFSRRGDIGRFALVKQENNGSICGTGALRVRLSEKLNSSYLASYLTLKPVIEWLNSNAVGQTMLNLNTSILSSLPVVVPSSQEQTIIAGSIDAVDSNVTLKHKKLYRLKNTKKALMQDLLTGKVRVKVD